MNFDIGSMIRDGSISPRLGANRSTQRSAPKSTFGDKVGGNATSANDDARWRAELDRVHSRLRSATNPYVLGRLLDRYAVLAAMRAKGMTATTTAAAPFVPGAAVLTAAIGAVNRYDAGSGG